ncbi:mitofusin [Apophysomyces sp. BC1034]|nr:mitofusin [Apophysomyces sp. BC1015]KAG0176187.1 mitofusin [Apophysomyces sp. BC1021]KAG0183963.1 mitofusin [Apophysomyces sp. BC1034]
MSSQSYYGVPSSSMSSSRRSFRRNSAPNIESLDDSYFNASHHSTGFKPQPLDMRAASPFSPGSPILNSPAPSPTSSTASMRAARTHQHRLNAAQEQRTYHDSCQRLLTHISSVMGICEDLRGSNKEKSLIHYPVIETSNRPLPQRSQTLANPTINHGLETASQPDIGSPSSVIDAVRRSSIHSAAEPMTPFAQTLEQHRLLSSDISKELNILNLNLKVGHSTADLGSLEKQSIANLLDEKLSQCVRHLENLFTRVADTSSKVLVTGDLNSGKSTFVNALLKRELLPADQQPCTSMFCEVLDATINDGVEQVHAIPDVEKYNRLNPETYHLIEMRHLYKVITEHYEHYKMLKIYASDARSTQESLLHNGVVDIALIDSPGLNTDSVKTTAVFARQEEIDVVVFVVSAENHFTLSGKEFLWNAANEKTHIFIVVNRFDSIRDKDRCKRLILEQIRQLSPATYADADDLVHFVSAGNVDLEPGSRKLDAPEFARLEQRLRAFVLENRAKSKLSPAKNYLVNLLTDINLLSKTNKTKAAQEHNEALQELERDLPAYENLLRVRDRLLNQVEKVAESSVMTIQRQTVNKLTAAMENVGSAIGNIEYPGILLVWQYAQDVADSMSRKLLKDVRQMENQARQDTSKCICKIHDMGTENLGNYPTAADVEKMFLKNHERRVIIHVEPTDLVDLVLDEKLSGAALSFGAAAMVGGRMLGIKDAMSSICSMSGALGAQNIRRLIVPVVSIATVGFLVYVVSDMRYAVERKLLKKFQAAARDTAYIEGQSNRISREARKLLRVEGWEIQNRLQKAIENKEIKRTELESLAHTSRETIEYFSCILDKSMILLDKVEAVKIENTHHHKGKDELIH